MMPWMMRTRDGYDNEDLTNKDEDQTDIFISHSGELDMMDRGELSDNGKLHILR